MYREAIGRIRGWPEFQEMDALPEAQQKAYGDQIKKKKKERILQRCRSSLPEECLPWLDAAYALYEKQPDSSRKKTSASSVRKETPFYTPLLGSGGNDGNMEFSNNFMQRVYELLVKTPEEKQKAWLHASLFDVPVASLPVIKVGQFDPGNAGGRNQGTSFNNEQVPNNPWDFIFMLEGTLLFASALVRRSPGDASQASAPFSVTSLPAGFPSSPLQDTGWGEIWMPLWSRPASVRELRRLLGEGRASLGKHQVRDGLDFARAAAMLGVDRGIDDFERFSFLKRRGKSYVALPSGRVSVEYRPSVAYLHEVSEYLKLRPLVKETTLPASFLAAHRRLTEAVFTCIEKPEPATFIAVSRRLAHLDALPALPKYIQRPCSLPKEWIQACDDGTPEFRLAAAIASLKGDGALGPMRAHLAPVDPDNIKHWEKDSSQYVPWRGEALEGLGKILQRRLLDAKRLDASPWCSAIRLDPADLFPLVYGLIDATRLAELVRAFSLVQFPATMRLGRDSSPPCHKLPYAVALLKALHTQWPNTETALETRKLQHENRIAHLIGAGRIADACAIAAQRMRAAGGGSIYLPATFEETFRGIQPLPLLVCLLVPVDSKKLLKYHLELHSQP